jgi:hypothetical protein
VNAPWRACSATELGLGYQQWRQQVVLAHALPLLSAGHTHQPGGSGQRLRQRQRVFGHVQDGHGAATELTWLSEPIDQRPPCPAQPA